MMLKTVGISFFVIVAAGAAVYRSAETLPFALGAALGVAVNAAKIVMLDRAVDKAIGFSAEKSGNYIRLNYLIRFALTGAVLYIAVVAPFINMWGAAAGVVSMQAAVIAARFDKGDKAAARGDSA